MRKTNPSKLTTKITCITELVDEDIKTAITTTFLTFKNVSRDIEDMIEDQTSRGENYNVYLPFNLGNETSVVQDE